jgi:hypothetical protein
VTDEHILQWQVIGYTPGGSMVTPDPEPNTWQAPYHGGWLVLHAGPNGHEALVWVPDQEQRS